MLSVEGVITSKSCRTSEAFAGLRYGRTPRPHKNAWPKWPNPRTHIGNLKQTFKAPLFREEGERPLDGLFRGQFARAPSMPQEIEQGGVRPGESGPGLWPTRVNDRVAANELPRKAEGTRCNLLSAGRLGGEPEEVCSSNPGGEHGFAVGCKLLDIRGIRAALAESGFPAAIVDPLAQAFNRSVAGQSG